MTATDGAGATLPLATGAKPAGAPTGVPERYVVEAVEVAAADGMEAGLEGRVLIVDDGRGIALELADLLEQRGAEAVTVDLPTQAQLADAAAFVHLGALRPGGGPLLPEGFAQFRDALAGPVRTLLVATGTGGTFGHGYRDAPGDAADLGLRGLIRTIAAEYPQLTARAVDVKPKESPRTVAAQLLAELTHPGGPSVVGYRDGRRTGLAVRRAAPASPRTGWAWTATAWCCSPAAPAGSPPPSPWGWPGPPGVISS